MRALQHLFALGLNFHGLVLATNLQENDRDVVAPGPQDHPSRERDVDVAGPGDPLPGVGPGFPGLHSNHHSKRVLSASEREERDPQSSCSPLSPWCSTAKRDIAAATDDWTRWACARGVRWACNYPETPHDDPEKRGDNASHLWHSCSRAGTACHFLGLECACEYLTDCDEDGEYQGPIKNGMSYCLCRNGFQDQCAEGGNYNDDMAKRTASRSPASKLSAQSTHQQKRDTMDNISWATHHLMYGQAQSSAAASPPGPTVTKVVTVTKRGRYAHHRHYRHYHHDPEWMKDTATIARVGSETVRITKPVQLVNNRTLIHAMPQAEATLVPLIWDPRYLEGWEHLMDMNMEDTRKMYPDADWDEVPRLAFNLRKHHGEMEPEVSFKYALIMLMRGWHNTRYGPFYGGFPPITPPDPHLATKTLAYVNGTAFAMTKSTQTFHGHVLVADPLARYKMFDPIHHAIAPTGSCGRKAKHSDCLVERCMWDFMKPINVTTVAPMAMHDHYGDMIYDYFTHRTELHGPHWGTTKSKGLYYPTQHTHRRDAGGHPTHAVVRQTPDGMHKNHHQQIHGNPICYDLHSCHSHCSREAKQHSGFDLRLLAMLLSPILSGFLLGSLLCCCCIWYRRRKRDPNRKNSSVIPEKLRRKSTTPKEAVVNQATGTATDPATGQHVEPATAATVAVLAGSAAGAAAATTSGDNDNGNKKGGDQPSGDQSGNAGDDGRGTTARRAEEGRGRVNFEDGGKPGAEEAPAGTSNEAPGGSSAAAAAAAPSSEPAEAVPAHQTDGAPGGSGSYTAGRLMPDVGSMRGRKRNRPEGAGGLGLNLGF